MIIVFPPPAPMAIVRCRPTLFLIPTPVRSTHMDSPQPLCIAHHFRDLPDPRLSRLCEHDLLDILTITICAVLCGQHPSTHIDFSAQPHHSCLKTFLRLPTATPSPDPSP